MTKQTEREFDRINNMARKHKKRLLAVYAAMVSKRIDWGPEYDRPLISEVAYYTLGKM